MGVDPTGSPTVSMRLGDDHTAEKNQVKFNETLNQAKSDDDEASSSETTPQRKAIGGSPTTQSLVDSGPRQFTDGQIYGETDAASKRIDKQIAQDREISRTPFEDRIRGARAHLILNSEVGDNRYTLSRTTGEQLYTYGRDNGYPIDPLFPERGKLPSFTSNELGAVKKAQGENQKENQQAIEDDNKGKLARVQSDHYQNWVNQGDQNRSPEAIIQPFAFGAFGAPVYMAYAGIQTGNAVGDAVNACKNGPTADCFAATTRAGIAVATDVYALKSSAQSKAPPVDPPRSLASGGSPPVQIPAFSTSTEAEITALMKEHPTLTRVNAERAVTGPQGTVASAAGAGGRRAVGGAGGDLPPNADITFRQPTARGASTVLRREVKTVEGNQGKFNDAITGAADQLQVAGVGGEPTKVGGEVLVQVPEGFNAREAVQRFKGSVLHGEEGMEKLGRYRSIHVTIVDPQGTVLLDESMELPMTRIKPSAPASTHPGSGGH